MIKVLTHLSFCENFTTKNLNSCHWTYTLYIHTCSVYCETVFFQIKAVWGISNQYIMPYSDIKELYFTNPLHEPFWKVSSRKFIDNSESIKLKQPTGIE